ncbi:MAG: Oligopeptide-binding protein AppA precursor [Chloroflexi bacterium ADurb.Bin325]|nr:MAG: Oligopeptide-binding protein AppA precursor [Chloroflexi bacterium ADurb.Bin325]
MSLKKLSVLLSIVMIASMVLSACATPAAPAVPQVVTQIVEKEVEVEKVVTQVVETVKEVEKTVEVVKEVAAEEYTTPHPILSDVRVRQAIAYCMDRDALIASVYDYVDDPEGLIMDSPWPKTHWVHSEDYDFPMYDPDKGKALLEEAGWHEAGGQRVNDKGDVLALKFTTTNAAFRQTWGAVFIQNMAACGIQILPSYVPASWWFGDTTGLARRDFELGAYAWVGQTEPAGRTLYACNQIPLPSNNWEGQNYMGWCNQTASDAVVRATNTLLRDDRVAAYDIVQKEFAKDVVSIPVFQRAEAEAWSSDLQGIKSDVTEYATTNLHEWALADGSDTIVIGMTQEPDSMLALVSSMAAQRLVDRPAKGVIVSQYDYDFQAVLQDGLSTIESGLATNDTVEVNAGDKVYNTEGDTVELAAGVSVFDADGNTVEYDGSGTVSMKQLKVTYKLQDYTWSDGQAGSVEDIKLGHQFDCDRDSGATTFILCDAIVDVTFADDALETTVTYAPGYQDPTYHLFPFSLYPSHQVLSDGRNLKDVPAAEWLTLPEIAETPLSFGAYYVKEWVKGQSMTLAANPYYWGGEVKTPNVIYTFVADTNQAVAQLLNGDVDFLDSSTLGAGSEVKTVIDAAKATGAVTYNILASSTWEHIDINLFVK